MTLAHLLISFGNLCHRHPKGDQVHGYDECLIARSDEDLGRDAMIRRDQDRHQAIAELQQLVDEGIASGPARHLDVEAFLARKRDQSANTNGH
ncbi:type II toxin-antitoxin system ParD family antitoxin [Loktanella salsilacus]|uniref:ribbon-helix-helix domain-containing protein n=1 Tax=Loktanella salsilacus TaxID=195913 RepID=UPI0037362BCF